MNFEVLKRLIEVDRLVQQEITQTVFSSMDEEFHIFAYSEGLEPAAFSWGAAYDKLHPSAPEPGWVIDIMFAFPEDSAVTMSYYGEKRSWTISVQMTKDSTDAQQKILADLTIPVCMYYDCSFEELKTRPRGTRILTDELAYQVITLMAKTRKALHLPAGK